MFQENLPSIKTDEILELQTCIQPLPSRVAQEQAYLVAVESVRDGHWTSHCEGTAVVSTSLDHNGVTAQAGESNRHKVAKKDSRTTTFESIKSVGSDEYQLHPLTIYRCLQHALASAASGEQHGGGAKVAEVDEFRVWSSDKRICGGNWTAHAVDRGARLEDQVVACVDLDLEDKTGVVASSFRGLRVMRCEGEPREAFDADIPPPEPNARVPAFLRPLLG